MEIAISLFSNCGAGDVGFRDAGFQFDIMAELDERRMTVCKWNHPKAHAVPGDLRETYRKVISLASEREISLLTACPPCQGMSTARSGLGKGNDIHDGISDRRNLLVEVIAEIALAVRPALIVTENVPAFLTKKVPHPDTGNPISAARLLVDQLSEHYQVYPLITDLADYGVPQSRRRAFLTFVSKTHPATSYLNEHGVAPYPVPTHAEGQKSLRQALLDLDKSGTREPLFAVKGENRSSSDPLHQTSILRKKHLRMITAIPKGTGASAWTNVCDNDDCGFDGQIDEEAVFCPACDTKLPRPIVERDGDIRLVKGFRRSSYRRMDPSKPASTITTASGRMSSDINIHPTEDRVLSPRECAHLQTIGESFAWSGPDPECMDESKWNPWALDEANAVNQTEAISEWGVSEVRAMIGEAVPPHFTRLHGKALNHLLKVEKPSPEKLISDGDERCANAYKKLFG